MDLLKNKFASLFVGFALLGVLPMNAQNASVRGKVTSVDGEPLIGATIQLKGTSQRVVSDVDGYFSLDVPHKDSGVMVFSYIGCITKEIKLTDANFYNVRLEDSHSDLDEIVVVGYGGQKKVNLTGAVASMKLNDVKDIPVTNTSSLLQGRMSGVTVSSFSAQPGADDDVQIRIRGIGTFNNNNPLILIDGVEGSLSSVAPNDIENISVLKDAASAAIYGVRAANGVILVTTKTSANGSRRLSYNGSIGVQSATVLPDYLDSWQWAVLFNECNNALGGDAPQRNYTDDMIALLKNGSDPDHFANTNWMKEIFRTALVHQHHLLMTGGTADSKYMASMGYIKQEGIMKGTDTQRANFRLNADTKYLKILTLGVNAAGSYQTIAEPIGGVWNIFNDVVGHIHPTIPVKYSNGHWGQYDGNPQFPKYSSNPVEQTTYQSGQIVYRFDGKVYLDIEPIKNLHIKSSFAYQYGGTNYKAFVPTYQHYKADGTSVKSGVASLEENFIKRQQWINENIVTYDFILAGVHNFGVLLGESQQYNGNKYNEMKGENFLTNNVESMDVAQTTTSYGREEKATLRSIFGRLNYNFNGTYLFEFNLRRDESSRLPQKNRTGYFPSVSAGWNVAQEKFMQQQKLFDALKLRVSWGKLGNQEIGYYPYKQTYTLGKTNYIWGTDKIIGAALASAANPDIKWETTTTTDIGLDIALLNNKFGLTFDWYNKISSDILLQLPISSLIGVDEAPYVNAAKVQNRGWELSLRYNDSWRAFQYGATLNLSHVDNKIKDVSGRENWIDNWTINREGYPIGSYFGYVADGLYASEKEIADDKVGFGSPKVGDIRYKDLDGNDEITDADRTVIGNPFPKFTYGLNLTAAYKGIDFSLFFQGITKVNRIMMDRPTIGGGVTKEMWNRYNAESNPTGTYPELGNESYNSLPSSFWIKSAAYCRLKNLELGYTLPASMVAPLQIQNLRFYVSMQNILTLTNVKNYDPEKYAADSNNATYPNAKSVSFGLNITL